MEAFQFTTKAKDGNIKIPEKYLNSLKEEFTVIILLEKKEKKVSKVSRELKAVKIKTKGFKFDREEANRR